MKRVGFQNVRRLSGSGSGDLKRDIHAEENLPSITGMSLHTKILVQCKNYAGSEQTISPSMIEDLANRAKSLKYNRILIITSHKFSSNAKSFALNLPNNPNWYGMIAECWNKYDLTTLLLKHTDLLRRYSIHKITPSALNIGILDGFASNRSTENPCVLAFTNVSPTVWGELLRSEQTEISSISATEINSSFDAILNPFGETYPEEDFALKTTYQRILKYIRNGGLFVNVAGFPFFYYWDHKEGRNEAIATSRYFYNQVTRVNTQFWSFTDTLLYRDFGISLNGGSPTNVTIYQEPQDMNYVGNLLDLGIETVTEFRAVISESSKTIPLLRAREGQILPLSAIKFGYGYLMVSGLELHEREAPIIAKALNNWLLTNGGELPLP